MEVASGIVALHIKAGGCAPLPGVWRLTNTTLTASGPRGMVKTVHCGYDICAANEWKDPHYWSANCRTHFVLFGLMAGMTAISFLSGVIAGICVWKRCKRWSQKKSGVLHEESEVERGEELVAVPPTRQVGEDVAIRQPKYRAREPRGRIWVDGVGFMVLALALPSMSTGCDNIISVPSEAIKCERDGECVVNHSFDMTLNGPAEVCFSTDDHTINLRYRFHSPRWACVPSFAYDAGVPIFLQDTEVVCPSPGGLCSSGFNCDQVAKYRCGNGELKFDDCEEPQKVVCHIGTSSNSIFDGDLPCLQPGNACLFVQWRAKKPQTLTTIGHCQNWMFEVTVLETARNRTRKSIVRQAQGVNSQGLQLKNAVRPAVDAWSYAFGVNESMYYPVWSKQGYPVHGMVGDYQCDAGGKCLLAPGVCSCAEYTCNCQANDPASSAMSMPAVVAGARVSRTVTRVKVAPLVPMVYTIRANVSGTAMIVDDHITCEIKDPQITGCYSCDRGALLKASCVSVVDTAVMITCNGQESSSNCGELEAWFSISEKKETVTCQFRCPGNNHTLGVPSQLHYLEVENHEEWLVPAGHKVGSTGPMHWIDWMYHNWTTLVKGTGVFISVMLAIIIAPVFLNIISSIIGVLTQLSKL